MDLSRLDKALHRTQSRVDRLMALVAHGGIAVEPFREILKEVVGETGEALETYWRERDVFVEDAVGYSEKRQAMKLCNNIAFDGIQIYETLIELYGSERGDNGMYDDAEDARAVMEAHMMVGWFWTRMHLVPMTGEDLDVDSLRQDKVIWLSNA
jgi:hypothetical protein